MSNPPEDRDGSRASTRISSLTDAGDAVSALLPLKPQMSIDEIVAAAMALGSRQVELLVPNNTKALQSLAGCEMLKRTLTAAAIYVTLFTADEKTAAAARIAKLDVVSVGGAIVAPSGDSPRRRPTRPIPVPPPRPNQAGFAALAAEPPSAGQPQSPTRPSQPAGARPTSELQQGSASKQPSIRGMTSPTTSVQAPSSTGPGVARPAPSDDAFLAGLEAFDRAQNFQEPVRGDTLSSDEGALLFDAPGDLGVPRPNGARQDAWDSAFEDLGTTMAAEPSAPRPVRRGPPAAAADQNAVPSGRALFGSLVPRLPRRGQRGPKSASPGPLMQRPQRSAEEAALRTRQSRRLLVWPLVLLGLLIVITGGWVIVRTLGLLSPAATIALTPPAPRSTSQSFTGLAIPLRDQPVTDPSSFEVQATVLEQPVSVTVQGQAISTTLTPIGRATGVIFLRNTLSQPVVVRAGTVARAATGVQFTVQEDTTVPAAAASADGITFGRGQASLKAVVPGGAGNIPPGSIAAIPGFEGTLRVEQGQFAGGSDQEVHIVRTEDVNRVLPDAVSQLYGAGVNALQMKLAERPSFTLVTPTVTPTLDALQHLQGIDYGVFPPIGGVATDGTFKLEVRGLFHAVAEPGGATLADQLPRAVRNQLVNTGRVNASAQVQIKSFTIANQSLIVGASVTPSGTTPQLPPSLLREVQTAIVGKPRNEALNYLQSLIKDGKIAAFSPLPEQWTTVPAQVGVKQASQ